MHQSLEPVVRRIDEERALRAVVEGTASVTGQEFYRALVRNLALSLDTHGAWVTESDEAADRLRALAFWFGDSPALVIRPVQAGAPCDCSGCDARAATPHPTRAALVAARPDADEQAPRPPQVDDNAATRVSSLNLRGAGGHGFAARLVVSGIIAAPFTGPVLAAALAFVATQGSVLFGGGIMFVYSLGLGLLFCDGEGGGGPARLPRHAVGGGGERTPRS